MKGGGMFENDTNKTFVTVRGNPQSEAMLRAIDEYCRKYRISNVSCIVLEVLHGAFSGACLKNAVLLFDGLGETNFFRTPDVTEVPAWAAGGEHVVMIPRRCSNDGIVDWTRYLMHRLIKGEFSSEEGVRHEHASAYAN